MKNSIVAISLLTLSLAAVAAAQPTAPTAAPSPELGLTLQSPAVPSAPETGLPPAVPLATSFFTSCTKTCTGPGVVTTFTGHGSGSTCAAAHSDCLSHLPACFPGETQTGTTVGACAS